MEPSEVGSGPQENLEQTVINAVENEEVDDVPAPAEEKRDETPQTAVEESTEIEQEETEEPEKEAQDARLEEQAKPESESDSADVKSTDNPSQTAESESCTPSSSGQNPEQSASQEENKTASSISESENLSENQSRVQEMCPEKERKFRIENELVHKFEMIDGEPAEHLMVKEYRRSAADLVEMNEEDSLRSKSSLEASIQHLLTNIMMLEEPFQLKFDFIDDRLRAVRQELTIQRLTLTWFGCKQLLSCVKFYLIARRLFNTVDIDATANADRLHACSTRIFECISSISEFVKAIKNEDLFGREIQTTRDAFSAMILTRLDDLKPSGLIYSTIFHRMSELLSNGVCLLPIELLKAYMTENWCKFARIFNRLSRIQQIAAEPYVLSLRKVCLSSCAVAYHNQQIPLRMISSWLVLTVRDTRLLLESSEGAKVAETDQDGVFAIFNKKEFQLPEHECLSNPAAGEFSFQVLAHMLKTSPEVGAELLSNSTTVERSPAVRTNQPADTGRVPVLSKNPLDNIASDDDDTPIWMKSGNKSNRKNHRRQRDSEKKEKQRRDSNRDEKDSFRENDRHHDHWSEPKRSGHNRHRNRNKKDNFGGSRGARKPGSTASRSWQHDDRTRTAY